MRHITFFILSIGFAHAQLHIRGSETAYPLVNELASQYRQLAKDFPILVSSSSNNLGFLSIKEGQADIAMSCRPVKTGEILRFEESKLKLVETPIAIDPLVAVVSKDSPISKLSIDEVSKIFSGVISNWSSIDKNVNVPIELVGLPLEDPITIFLNDNLSKTGTTPEKYKEFPGNDEIYKYVLHSKAAIAFLPLSYYKMHKSKLNLVPITFDHHHYFDEEKIESALFEYPLSRVIFFYHVKKNDENLEKFLEFVKSDKAKSIVNSKGFYAAY